MNIVRVLLPCSATLLVVGCDGPIPNRLVGTWAPASAEFRGEELVRGEVVYLRSDGPAVRLTKPRENFPGSGLSRGMATYSPESNRLALTFQLFDDQHRTVNWQLTYVYNAQTKCLEPTRGGQQLIRRPKSQPGDIRE